MRKAVRESKATEKELRDKHDEREAVVWELSQRSTRGCDEPCQTFVMFTDQRQRSFESEASLGVLTFG